MTRPGRWTKTNYVRRQKTQAGAAVGVPGPWAASSRGSRPCRVLRYFQLRRLPLASPPEPLRTRPVFTGLCTEDRKNPFFLPFFFKCAYNYPSVFLLSFLQTTKLTLEAQPNCRGFPRVNIRKLHLYKLPRFVNGGWRASNTN